MLRKFFSGSEVLAGQTNLFGRLSRFGNTLNFSTTPGREDTDEVLLKLDEKTNVASIILNKPKVHNCFSETVIAQIQEKLDECIKLNPRVLVLKSNGKNFSAGADLNYMKRQGGFSKEENVADAMKLSGMFQTLATMTMPTIAVVQGSSFGGALGLIAACDIGLAESTSKFCFSEVKLGIIPATISPFVVRKIGKSQAMRLFLNAELFDASVALNIGLIHECTSASTPTLADLEKKYLNLLLSNGPNALQKVKELLALDMTEIDNDLRMKTAEILANARCGPEAKEGLSAFLEKRSPNYKVSS